MHRGTGPRNRMRRCGTVNDGLGIAGSRRAAVTGAQSGAAVDSSGSSPHNQCGSGACEGADNRHLSRKLAALDALRHTMDCCSSQRTFSPVCSFRAKSPVIRSMLARLSRVIERRLNSRLLVRRHAARGNPLSAEHIFSGNAAELIQVHELRPGDVLLCWPKRPDPIATVIQISTKNPYVHAAIVHSTTPPMCAEVRFQGGLFGRGALRLTGMNEFINRYQHVAVLRHPDAWPPISVSRLHRFVSNCLGRTRYKAEKTMRIQKRRDRRWINATEHLNAFFEGKVRIPRKSNAFYCSEFVVRCFIEGGYLDDSAAILYWPEDTAPGHLLVDNTFGFLVGYLSCLSAYKIPEDEPLRRQTPYHALFK
jgi:hypothetical protein